MGFLLACSLEIPLIIAIPVFLGLFLFMEPRFNVNWAMVMVGVFAFIIDYYLAELIKVQWKWFKFDLPKAPARW